MVTLPWSSRYETGIEMIDKQHKKLFEIINMFIVMANINPGNANPLGFIDELIHYANFHFQDEERFMEMYRYPRFEIHRNKHVRLRNELVKIREKIYKFQAEDPIQLAITFGERWLIDHLDKEDAKFSKYCVECRVYNNPEIVGCKCDILSLENEFIGQGTIVNVANGKISINNDGTSQISVIVNEVVKIALTKFSMDVQLMLATVLYPGFKDVYFHDAKIIKRINERRYDRAVLNKPGRLMLENDERIVIIHDISQGGLLIGTNQKIMQEGPIKICFAINNVDIIVEFAMVREVQSEQDIKTIYRYGCKFTQLEQWQEDVIADYVSLANEDSD